MPTTGLDMGPEAASVQAARRVLAFLDLPEARDTVSESVAELIARLESPIEPAELAEAIETTLAVCRKLYGRTWSHEALPLARAALACATRHGQAELMRRAATASGLLSSDTGDLVAAIEHHVQALRLATAAEDRVEMSRIWNNIGAATAISGNYEMASRCFRRALALVDKDEGPMFSRFAACCNLADSLYKVGRIAEGLAFAERSLLEMTPEFQAQDSYGAVLLRRNLVRLLLAEGRVEDAEVHVREAALLAQASVPRARIAAETTRATFEVALGRFDIALTRLDKALSSAREMPATLQDTLACAIRAEEAAGNPARALLRLEELSDHVYRSNIEQAREQVKLAGLREVEGLADLQEREQAKARLISQLEPPAQPEGWKALQRLGVSAALRMDETGWHGVRVGALTRALAQASGTPPLQALEIGLAAELHDIGMTAVPAAILAKAGPLNDAERAIVLRHARAGAEMLSDGRHPRMLLAHEIALYHHARWDGEGYPPRVGGDFIPLPARMCAVADAYDMMVCGYGGTKPRSMGEALDELRREAGRQFAPELVECFGDMIRSETRGRGVDLSSNAGMEDFQQLVLSLKEDRGFI